MSTISELMEGKVPGSVKVRLKNWGEDHYFVPYFELDDDWHGISFEFRRGDMRGQMDVANTSWELWSPSKKKKTLYQWAFQDPDTKVWDMESMFFGENIFWI